jgi:hypothetical protein
MKRFRVNQHSTRLGMEQPALLRHFGSTALRVALARLRNSPCPPAWPRHGSNSPRRPPSLYCTADRLGSRSPGVLASVIREAGCSIQLRNLSGQGTRDFAGEARWCVARRLTRGPAVQGWPIQAWTDRRPLGGWGAPQPGRRATTAAWMSLREANPCPDGIQVKTHTIS